MEEDIKKKPTVEILNEMNKIDDNIWLLIVKYNKLAKEMVARYPMVEKHDEFKPKVLSIRR